MFEPRARYCHLHLVCISVCYKRKMHGTSYIFESVVKNLMCFNFVEVWAMQKIFYTEIFQMYGMYFKRINVYNTVLLS